MKRKMLQYSPELSAYLEEKIKKHGFQATKQKMFGHEVFFLNGYMFSGANVEGIFVHTGEEEREVCVPWFPPHYYVPCLRGHSLERTIRLAEYGVLRHLW